MATNNIVGIQVEPIAKKTLEKTFKKLEKVVAILKADGWVTSDDVTFYHPLVKDSEQVRRRLYNINLLTTNKCRITINSIDQSKIEIA